MAGKTGAGLGLATALWLSGCGGYPEAPPAFRDKITAVAERPGIYLTNRTETVFTGCTYLLNGRYSIGPADAYPNGHYLDWGEFLDGDARFNVVQRAPKTLRMRCEAPQRFEINFSW